MGWEGLWGGKGCGVGRVVGWEGLWGGKGCGVGRVVGWKKWLVVGLMIA